MVANATLRLIAGVGALLRDWACSGIRWIGKEEKLTLHFIKRFIAVEKKLKGGRHFSFPLRFLRYAIHHYHLIPPWVKVLKIIVIAGLILWQPLWQLAAESMQKQALYAFYYKHGLEHYQKYTTAEEAAKLASAYAGEFSHYYSSSSYKEALRSALPSAPTPTLIQAAAKAPTAIRDLQIAPIGIELIQYFESLRLKPYRDPVGLFTIGYGHLMRKGEQYTAISKEQALALLRKDIAVAELVVKRHVHVPLSVSQFSALVSLVYNIGEYQFRTSTLVKVINQQNYLQAAEEIRRWERAGGKVLRGLSKRRYAEYLLFTGKWKTPA